jgi:hypothetical protein
VSVRDIYILTIDLPILLQEICGPILGIYKSLTDTEIWTEAAQFPEKEYRNEIFVAVGLQYFDNILDIRKLSATCFFLYTTLRSKVLYMACPLLGEKSPPARVSL